MNKPTPDLIETMHADERGVIDLMPEHLTRLASSARALGYPYPGDSTVIEAIQRACVAHTEMSLRVRLLLSASGSLSVQAVPLGALLGTPLIGLSPIVLNSQEPLLQHKTTHRPWYDVAADWLSTHPPVRPRAVADGSARNGLARSPRYPPPAQLPLGYHGYRTVRYGTLPTLGGSHSTMPRFTAR